MQAETTVYIIVDHLSSEGKVLTNHIPALILTYALAASLRKYIPKQPHENHDQESQDKDKIVHFE
jgi:hypothetical protein